MHPDRFAKLVGKWTVRLGTTTTFSCADFEEAVAKAKAGDFVYMDPPYAGSTNRYQANLDSAKLRRVLTSLNERGVKWALSFDGFRGEVDLREHLPSELFVRHMLLDAGHSRVKRVLSGSVEQVRESLYLNY